MARSRKKDEKKISLKDTFRRIAWGRYLAITLISAWMFVLGILVGRGTAPVKFDIEKLSRELEELRAGDIKKQMAPVEVEADEEKTKTSLGFYEELKKSDPVAVTPVRPRSELNKTRAKQQKESASTTAKTATAVKKEPDPKSSPSTPKAAATNAPEKKPEAETAANAKGVTIQVASLKALNDADALVKKLKGKGYPAYKTIAVVPDKGIWFRIRVGRYSSREATADTIGRLKKEGFQPMVVDRK